MAELPSTKPLVEKLGARAGQRWILLGEDLDDQAAALGRVGVTTARRLPTAADAVILRAREKKDLDQLTRLRAVIAPAGAIWVFWRKGRPDLREDDVRGAAITQGLVDVKVIRVSDELSGLKLVIPVAMRQDHQCAGPLPVVAGQRMSSGDAWVAAATASASSANRSSSIRRLRSPICTCRHPCSHRYTEHSPASPSTSYWSSEIP
jgi:hypothetical protein